MSEIRHIYISEAFIKCNMRRKKELQTELPMYIDVGGIMFEPGMLMMLKRFQVEAFPYES
jgi:hypothetical protein